MRRKYNDLYFLLPAFIVVVVVTQIPFVLTIIFSTLKWNLARPDLGIHFIGLKNYLHYLKMPEFYSILLQTIVIMLSSMALCTFFGFLLSILLDHRIPGINLARTLILGPFFVMSVASGVIWKTTIFNTTFGWYGVIVKALGGTPTDMLSYHPMGVIIFLFTWKWVPFFVLIMLAGLQGISQDIMDSMKIDGANWFRATFQIKLPSIANHIRVAVMLGMIFLVKEIGLILVTTAGGPGTRSYTLPYMVYMTIFNGSEIGRAGALAVMTVIIMLLAVNLLYRWIKGRREA